MKESSSSNIVVVVVVVVYSSSSSSRTDHLSISSLTLVASVYAPEKYE